MGGNAESRAGEKPRDYVTEEGIVVGDEGRFELCLGIWDVGKGWGGHWVAMGFSSEVVFKSLRELRKEPTVSRVDLREIVDYRNLGITSCHC